MLTRLLVLLSGWLLAGALWAAEGLDSQGNVDAVLTWGLGDLAPGGSARQVVLFAHAESTEALAALLGQARTRCTKPLPSSPAGTPAESATKPAEPLWIRNEATDFGLETPGFFRWRLVRQGLACAQGGQLSQFSYYVHYRDHRGEQRAGIWAEGDSTPENWEVAEPLRRLGEAELAAGLRTADRELLLRLRVVLGPGAVVALEFTATNQGQEPLADVRLSAYANLEAAHTHEGDLSFLDRRTAGLVVLDPGTGLCVGFAGLTPPVSGWSGTWNSMDKMRTATGKPLAEWREFSGPTPEMKRLAERCRARALAPPGIYLPYIKDNPATPPTRDLDPAEARAALDRDWLFQAAGEPLAARALREVGWARELAARLRCPANAQTVDAGLACLAALEAQAAPLARRQTPDTEAQSLYLQVRTAKRDIAFANPALDFRQLLFIDQPMPSGPVNDIHEAIHRMGITATPGGRLLVLDGLHPGGALRQLAPERPGSFWRPDLSAAGTRLLFCYKAHDEKSFHLYEMNLDGSGRRQLTHGDYDDIDPLYLPDGHILFTTTRGNSYVRCGPFIWSYILARCDADGGNVYLTSYGGEPDFVPALLPDGRVIYSRWEYTDKPLWRVQSLWTTNQDGTGTAQFWGNQSVWPDHLSEPRPIPGSRRVMFSGVGHHDWWSGSIGIVDPDRGRDYDRGLTKVTADLRWPECSLPPDDRAESPRYHAAGAYTGYKTPYPLSEQDFLVSARGADGRFRLYLMDVDGNRELVYEGIHNVLHAIPVRPGATPLCQPDRVQWPGTGKDRGPVQPGTFYCADVYDGVPDLPRGSARYLRVFQMDHKTYSTWRKTWRHSGPAVSVVQEEGVKRIVSEVPVAADGSVYFQAPAGRALHIQLLDQDYRCLQTMRSFTGLMPGETRGCVGCHEAHTRAAPRRRGLALSQPPTPISPPPWGPESIGYERFAQPVLDRYCGRCHQGEGKARRVLDLTLRPAADVFKEPYLTLVGPAGWGNPVPGQGQPGYGFAGALPVESMDPSMNDPRAYATLRPCTLLSYTSPLVMRAASGDHHGVKVDPLSLRRLMAWVDACCPFMGDEEIRALPDPDFPGIDELPIRPLVHSAPVIERP